MSVGSPLDKSMYFPPSFEERLQVPVLVVPVDKVGYFLHLLADCLLNLPRVSNVTSAGEFTSRSLMLSQTIKADDPSTYPEALVQLITREKVQVKTQEISFTYNTYTAEDVLAKVLPPTVVATWDYEIISHVALLRLLEIHRPYLQVIGEVFFDKLKKETIAAVIGASPPTVIAGQNNLEMIVKEGQCVFNFNLTHYIWSTRMMSERDRVLRKLGKSDVLLELGTGVGALGIQAAKFGCTVIGNETNEENFERLVKNAISNRVSNKFHAYKMSHVDLIRALVQQADAQSESPESHESYFLLKSPPIPSLPKRKFTHLLTDLDEETTVQVLTTIYGLYKGQPNTIDLPHIHCYLQSSSEIPREDLLKRINNLWRFKLPDFDELKYISSNKGVNKYYVSFKLPTDVAFAEIEDYQSEGEVEESGPKPATGSSLMDLQRSMAADIEFMQQSMKEGLQPSLLMSHLASFIGSGTLLKRASSEEVKSPSKKSKE